ncbi:MAG: amidase, partial [Pseudomonadota bacterium]|nr:amidase [Pseudomonadota bacterium]
MTQGVRDVSSERTIEACLARIAESEETIRAFAYLDPEAARRAAREQDRRGRPGLLAGMPVGIKDIFDTADMPTGCGSPIYADHRPRSDSAAVALIRRAGGIIMGKTVTTEFAWLTPGPTRNPLNPGHTPGGSSSGSAAAVAAGYIPLAIGSQTGGSVIRPASFCGIVGYKPSYGLIPTAGMKPFAWSLDTVGVFAARVADAALLGAALTGLEPQLPDLAPRFGFYLPPEIDRASEDVHVALDRARKLAEQAGARVVDVPVPEPIRRLDDAWRVLNEYEGARSLAYEFDAHPDELSDALRAIVQAALALTQEQRIEALGTIAECRQALTTLFGDADVLITPAAPGEAPEGLASTGDSVFNRHWTSLGTPCVTLPGLNGRRGLPVGIQ